MAYHHKKTTGIISTSLFAFFKFSKHPNQRFICIQNPSENLNVTSKLNKLRNGISQRIIMTKIFKKDQINTRTFNIQPPKLQIPKVILNVQTPR